MCHSLPAAAEKSLSLEDTDLDNEPGESVKESQVQKRSGSFDYVAHLKSGLLSGIGQASASIASGSSGGSSGGGDSYKSHEIVVHVSCKPHFHGPILQLNFLFNLTSGS